MALPLSGTHIALVSGVPFHNDYKHTRWFTSVSAQRSYFSNLNKVHLINDYASFQRTSDKLYVRVNKHIDQLRDANYLYFNNSYPDGKVFYAFITELVYVNDNLTNVFFEIDVVQTWMFDLNFKPSFVVREHRPQYYEDTGKPVINTIDEGLDMGTDYELIYQTRISIAEDVRFLVIVSKEKLHGGTQEVTPIDNAIPQPLSYYFIPFDSNMKGVYVEGTGVSNVLSSPIRAVLKGLYSDSDVVNQIVSLYVTDYFGVPLTYSTNTDGKKITFKDTNSYHFSNVNIAQVDGSNVYAFYVDKINSYEPMYLTSNFNVYDKFPSVSESKLLMYPYSLIQMTDFKGNTFDIKPQYIFRDKIRICVRGSMGLSNKVSYSIVNYNYDNTGGDSDAILYNLETGIIDNNPNDVPILVDSLASYIQGNRNSIGIKMKSAEFNGMMSVLQGGGNAMSSLFKLNAGGVANGVMQGISGAGNNLLKIQAIEAKGKDLQNVPPNVSQMGSNSAFDYGNGFYGVTIMYKHIRPEYKRKITDFFNMYGYKYHEVKVPNLHTRKYWNYVQCEGANITGNFDKNDIVRFNQVFDEGITLWHTNDMYNYNLNNEVL